MKLNDLRHLVWFFIFAFVLNGMGLVPLAQANNAFSLPLPGTRVELSPKFVPALLKGIKINPSNPFKIEFLLDTGNEAKTPAMEVSQRLIRYFYAALTIPGDDLWVNLSPYEHDRMISPALGQTDLGRDMLTQDYMLKQVTASLIYPGDKLGQEFWNKIYAQAQQLYGTQTIPVNTFNKVWIMPETAEVFEHNQVAYIGKTHLKVMLEEDYQALHKSSGKSLTHTPASNLVRKLVLPALEQEINEGKNFTQLRQIYNSLILATWYKRALQNSLLNTVYANKSKIRGVDVADKTIKERIYQQYLRAYKKGVFNFIKEDLDQTTGQMVPRKYFSGGEMWGAVDHVINVQKVTDIASIPVGSLLKVDSSAIPIDREMTVNQKDDAFIMHTGVLVESLAERQLKRVAEIIAMESRNLWFVRDETLRKDVKQRLRFEDSFNLMDLLVSDVSPKDQKYLREVHAQQALLIRKATEAKTFENLRRGSKFQDFKKAYLILRKAVQEDLELKNLDEAMTVKELEIDGDFFPSPDYLSNEKLEQIRDAHIFYIGVIDGQVIDTVRRVMRNHWSERQRDVRAGRRAASAVGEKVSFHFVELTEDRRLQLEGVVKALAERMKVEHYEVEFVSDEAILASVSTDSSDSKELKFLVESNTFSQYNQMHPFMGSVRDLIWTNQPGFSHLQAFKLSWADLLKDLIDPHKQPYYLTSEQIKRFNQYKMNTHLSVTRIQTSLKNARNPIERSAQDIVDDMRGFDSAHQWRDFLANILWQPRDIAYTNQGYFQSYEDNMLRFLAVIAQWERGDFAMNSTFNVNNSQFTQDRIEAQLKKFEENFREFATEIPSSLREHLRHKVIQRLLVVGSSLYRQDHVEELRRQFEEISTLFDDLSNAKKKMATLAKAKRIIEDKKVSAQEENYIAAYKFILTEDFNDGFMKRASLLRAQFEHLKGLVLSEQNKASITLSTESPDTLSHRKEIPKPDEAMNTNGGIDFKMQSMPFSNAMPSVQFQMDYALLNRIAHGRHFDGLSPQVVQVTPIASAKAWFELQ